ncbi:MAG: hypothetical protein ABI687_03475 [Flavitalea sp.]
MIYSAAMTIKNIALFVAVSLLSLHGWSQSGCTDVNANNFNAAAVVNDGSCTYATTNIPLSNAKTLSGTLDETSGLIFTGGKLWTMNDSGGPNQIFRLDSATGAILQTVTVTNATNVDWEDLAADDNYIYIGDFGNNAHGNRTNLRIYRVAKTDIGTGATANVTAGIINFSYQDQSVLTDAGNNNTNYDCEAFLVKDNVLHLFSKDWVDAKTRHYTLVNTPGTQVAVPVETLNVSGLITGVDISAHNDIVLLGYTTNKLSIFMYLLYDYAGDNFFSGNKRKFGMGSTLSFGQTEGITFINKSQGFISNERINSNPFFVSPMVQSFSLTSFLALPVKMTSFRAEYKDPEVQLTWQTASEMNSDFFSIEHSLDAIHFKEIGRKSSAGNSNSVIDYHFSDWQPADGINYYRLKQVDIDGSADLSDIKTVKVNLTAVGKLRAYISDSGNNKVIIDNGKTIDSKTTYQLININGMILKKGILSSQKQSVDITSFSKGQYIVRLSDGRSVLFSKK